MPDIFDELKARKNKKTPSGSGDIFDQLEGKQIGPEPAPPGVAQRAVGYLPEVGGMVGGIAGLIPTPLSPMVTSPLGAAAGGAAGTYAKNRINEGMGWSHPRTPDEQKEIDSGPYTGDDAGASISGSQEIDEMFFNAFNEGAFQFIGDLPARAAKHLMKGPLAWTDAAKTLNTGSGSPATHDQFGNFITPSGPSFQGKYEGFDPIPSGPKGTAKAPTPKSSIPANQTSEYFPGPAGSQIPPALGSGSSPAFSPPPLGPDMAGFKREVVQGHQKAMKSTLETLRVVTETPEISGLSVQERIVAGRAIWSRVGKEHYDKAKELTHGVAVPSYPVKKIAEQLLLESQSTMLTFPKTGTWGTEVFKMLDEIRMLPENVPFEALENYRSMLLSKMDADPLSHSRKEGVYKLITGGLTDAMVLGTKGMGGEAEAAANTARVFWREGAQLFDNSILTQAINKNPEDVFALIRPGGPGKSASITEARRIREGVLDFAEKYGTEEEVIAARKTYNSFLQTVTTSGIKIDDIAKLPENYAAYGEVIDILYSGTAEGRAIKANLDRYVNAIGELHTRMRDIPNPVVVKESKEGKTFIKNLDGLERKRAAKQKGIEAEIAAKEAEDIRADNFTRGVAKEKSERLKKEISAEDLKFKKSLDDMQRYQGMIAKAIIIGVPSATGIGFGLGGGLATATAASVALHQILKSPQATSYFIKGVNAIPRTSSWATPARISLEFAEHPLTPAWASNIMRAAKIGANEADAAAERDVYEQKIQAQRKRGEQANKERTDAINKNSVTPLSLIPQLAP